MIIDKKTDLSALKRVATPITVASKKSRNRSAADSKERLDAAEAKRERRRQRNLKTRTTS